MSATTTERDTVVFATMLGQDATIRGERLRSLLAVFGILFRSVRAAAILWLTLAILTGLVAPFQLWASGQLVNSITAALRNDRGESPWIWAGIMAGMLVLSRIFAPLSEWTMSLIRERSVPDLQARIYAHVAGVELAALEYQAFYDATQRIVGEANTSLRTMLTELRRLITSLVPAIGTCALVITIDWRLIVALILPLMPNLVAFFRSGTQLWTTLTNQTRDRRFATYIAARFSDRQTAKEIRLYGIRDLLIDRWAHHFMSTRDELRRKTTLLHLRLQVSSTLADIVSFAGFIWLLTGPNTRLSPGEITVLMGAFLTIGNRVFSVQMAFMELGRVAGFARDTHAFLRLPVPFTPAPLPSTTTPHNPEPLVASEVMYTYPGADHPVIDGISLVIPPGQTVAIVGENGAGKTTLLKLLLGLYTPDAGEVSFGDRPLRDIPIDERQARFSAVFQHFSRYPLTLEENITLHAPIDGNDIAGVVQVAGLERAIDDAQQGLRTVLAPDLGGTDLSGGQWQRVAIARAAYRDADILALDEPTAALDPVAEVDIFRRFAALAQGRTTLLVSHRLGMARLADRIIVVEQGRITEDGTHDDLLANGGHYAELWEMQARWYL